MNYSTLFRILFYIFLTTNSLANYLAFAQTNSNNNNNSNNSSNPFQLLESVGFNTLKENALDFELPLLPANENKKFSSFKGNWIMLVFWATWCGPCVYELPTLEKLYQKFKDKKFLIVGVSEDQGDDRNPRRFIKNNNITFPIFHDGATEIGLKYHAQALPTVYMISPDFKLVGIFRGATDWSNPDIANMITNLIAIKDVSKFDLAAAAGANAGAGASGTNQDKKSADGKSAGTSALALPNNLTPPTIVIKKLSKENFAVNEEINLEIEIKWKGDLAEYLMKVPTMILPEKGIKLLQTTSSSLSSGDEAILTYTFKLKTTADAQEGKYALGPIELAYQPRLVAGSELFSRSKSVEINITKSNLEKNFIWYILIIVIIAALSIIGYRYLIAPKRALKATQMVQQEQINFANQKQEEFRTLKEKKIKGQISVSEYGKMLIEFYISISNNIVEEVKENDEEIKKLQDIKNSIAYGGKILTDQELSHYEKKIEKKFEVL
ncbi:MAG: TlpA family protein disulfide reductase [Oligoflexia bacterium]|nr:TlpA family protein disulfide reductase [Oligoflexia bacterium]